MSLAYQSGAKTVAAMPLSQKKTLAIRTGVDSRT
jgi:hypothetical protein